MSLSNEDAGSGKPFKTLAIRLDLETHAQLSILAQLKGSNLTEEIRAAIEAHIAATKSSPELVRQAENVLEEFEREAQARRAAIATLFGSNEPPAKGAPAVRRAARHERSRRKIRARDYDAPGGAAMPMATAASRGVHPRRGRQA